MPVKLRRLLPAFAILAAPMIAAPPLAAAERTVTLSVEMSCPTCPYIVKRSLQAVEGVLAVAVSYEEQTATVRYEDTRTNVAALTEATAAVGFPAEPLATN